MVKKFGYVIRQDYAIKHLDSIVEITYYDCGDIKYIYECKACNKRFTPGKETLRKYNDIQCVSCRPKVYKIDILRAEMLEKHKDSVARVEYDEYMKPTYYHNCSICKIEFKPGISCLKNNDNIKCNRCTSKGKPYERTYNSLARRAERKGQEFTLTYEQFFKLCEIKECHYCKTPIKRAKHRNGEGTTGKLIDRKDSNIGYTYENSVPCCGTCNDEKGTVSYEGYLAVWDYRRNPEKYEDIIEELIREKA